MNITLKNKIKNRPTQIKNIKIGLTNKFSLKVTEKLHNDFKKFYQQYDIRRNKNFEKTFPELESWYNSL